MKNRIKMVMVVCLMMVLVLSTGASVFAASDDFVSSPSVNMAPVSVGFKANNEGCEGELVITAYSERESLDADSKALLESAYASIVDANDLTELNADLAKFVSNKNTDTSTLAVSDLFDASVVGCNNHENHAGFNVILKADTLDNFVSLLHMNKNGEWEIVKNAKVSQDGETIEFTVDSFSPFAIVVDIADYVAGDVNNDRRVDARDMIILERYLVGGWNITEGENFVLLLANINYPNDNVINELDVITLARFIAGGWNISLVVPESEAKTEGSVDSMKYSGLNNSSYESVQLSASNDVVASEGVSSVTYICVAVMAVAAIALVVILVKSKKNA